MKTLKNMRTSFLHPGRFALIGILFAFSCQKEASEKLRKAMPEKTLSDKVFLTQGGQPQRLSFIKLSRDTVYVISEPFRRVQGESLIVEAGTLIKLAPGVDITIEPGGLIEAIGTETSPIVFTSNLPRASAAAAWNGIILRGESASNQSNTIGQLNDSSGRLSFVRIEFGPLQLTNTGSGTTVDHVQVSYTGVSPAFTFDGGSVSASHLVSYACGGAADFYITNGYQGRLQFLLGLRHPFFGALSLRPSNSLSGIHIENSSSSNGQAIPFTNPAISNLTIIGPNARNGMPSAYNDTSGVVRNGGMVADVNATYQIRHALILGYPSSAWILGDSMSAFNLNFGKAWLTNSIFDCVNNYRAFYIQPDIYAPLGFGPYGPADFQDFALRPSFSNRYFTDQVAFWLEDPFNVVSPKPWPLPGSILFGGSDFSGPVFGNSFFSRVDFIGALGSQNWMNGWTNFTPLKTSYNEPE